MVEIRRIDVDEAPLVRELVRTATEELAEPYREDRIGISERGLSNLEMQFRVGAVHEDESTLVAVEGDRVVGLVCAWVTRGRATPGVGGEIDWLWVRPGPTRDALERRLAEAAVAWLRQRGAGAIFKMEERSASKAGTVESLGFEADGIRFSLYD